VHRPLVSVAIVGGGIAGALLAWRLTAQSRPALIEVFLDRPPGGADATGVSGGLVRAYETDPQACRSAAESLAELLGSATLREWSGYREVGSIYLTDPAVDPTGALDVIDRLLPWSAVAASAAELAGRSPIRGLPPGTVAVVERHAGYVSPARLRDAVLAQVATAGAAVHHRPVAGVTATPGVRLADGTRRRFDAVVVAAGAWSAPLLAAAGADTGALRTRRIQYDLRPGCPPGLGAFVDETSGLYGRPTGDGGLLLGLPSNEWGVDPQAVLPDPALADRVAVTARTRFGARTRVGPATRTVASVDCYVDPPGLALRPTAPGSQLFSFTGGSGGAVKTALSASRGAANRLLDLSPTT
jgi:glycine/D-amino acid oxidase-like deaminating enzyme